MNMVGHDHICKEVIEMPDILAVLERLYNLFGNLGITQPLRTKTPRVQRAVELNKPFSSGRLIASTPERLRQGIRKPPLNEELLSGRLPVGQVAFVIGLGHK